MSPHEISIIERMAFVGCTDQEIQASLGKPLTPELLETIQQIRQSARQFLPKPTPEQLRRLEMVQRIIRARRRWWNPNPYR